MTPARGMPARERISEWRVLSRSYQHTTTTGMRRARILRETGWGWSWVRYIMQGKIKDAGRESLQRQSWR